MIPRSAMPTSRRPEFLVIFVTVLITTIGFGVIFPILPIYAKKLGADDWTNGWLVAIFSLAQFAFAPLWGRLSDRVGRRPVMILSVLGSAAAYALTGWAHTIPVLFAARLLDGATGGSVAVAQACLADLTTPAERSKTMALIGVAFGLGFVIGPFVGGELASHFSPSTPFYFIAALSVFNAVWIYVRLPETLAAEHRSHLRARQGLGDLLRQPNGGLFVRLVVLYFLFLTGFSIMTFVFTLFNAQRFEFDEKMNGRLFGLIGIIGILVQGGLVRRLLPKLGEKPLVIFGSALLAFALFCLPMAGSFGILIALSCAIAVANSLIQPVLNGLVSRSVDAASQGRALGIFQSAASLGRTIGPVAGGFLLHLDAPATYGRSPFWTAAGLIAVMFALSLPLPRLVVTPKA
jgi:DHA1 family tetracycline resistance protein-like MFS transporter